MFGLLNAGKSLFGGLGLGKVGGGLLNAGKSLFGGLGSLSNTIGRFENVGNLLGTGLNIYGNLRARSDAKRALGLQNQNFYTQQRMYEDWNKARLQNQNNLAQGYNQAMLGSGIY